MSPEEAPKAPRRRGRPPGSKNKTTRRRRSSGGDVVGQLNTMVAELISENRKLRRQVAKLTAAGAGAATKTVERGLRTISRRVQRALDGGTKRKTAKRAPANGRRRRGTTTRRRKTAG